MAGGFAAIVTTPLDLAKTRIMLAGTSGKPELHDLRKLSVPKVLRLIYKETGFRGLFAGVTPRLGMILFGGLVFFGFYEETKRRFEDFFRER